MSGSFRERAATALSFLDMLLTAWKHPELPGEELDRIINFSAYERHAWVAEKARTLPEGARVLDAGAGECQYRDLFAHCSYEAQDFAQYEGTAAGPLQESWRYGQLNYTCDITAIPVSDGCFDAVLCTEVLEHVQRPIDVIRELARILRPKGRIFITAPLASGLHQRPFHYYGGYTPHFYETFFSLYGLEVVEVRPIGGLMKHVAQEAHRAGRILDGAIQVQMSPFARFVLLNWIPAYLARMEREMFVSEFTVGYLVEGRKAT